MADAVGSGAPPDRSGPPRRRVRDVVDAIARVVRLAGWGAAALAVVGFAGAIIPVADLASHFRVIYALAIIPALLVSRPGRRRPHWEAAALAVVFAINAAPIVTLYLPAGPRAVGPSLRLLQFNTWPRNPDDRAVLALVESERPDVASLQETSASLREAIGRDLSASYHVRSSGTELLLIRRDARIRLRGAARHTLPAGGEALSARLEVDGREVAVLSLHAAAPLGLSRIGARDAQLAWAARWCRAQPEPVIVLGDLNATPWSYPFRQLLREGGLVDSTRGFGVQPTWRTSYGPLRGPLAWPARIPIDHCLHAPTIATASRRVGPPGGSNHLPLLATLRLDPAQVPLSRRRTGGRSHRRTGT